MSCGLKNRNGDETAPPSHNQYYGTNSDEAATAPQPTETSGLIHFRMSRPSDRDAHYGSVRAPDGRSSAPACRVTSAVPGRQEWRKFEERHGFGLRKEALKAVVQTRGLGHASMVAAVIEGALLRRPSKRLTLLR
jgi:hypothetical protein